MFLRSHQSTDDFTAVVAKKYGRVMSYLHWKGVNKLYGRVNLMNNFEKIH